MVHQHDESETDDESAFHENVLDENDLSESAMFHDSLFDGSWFSSRAFSSASNNESGGRGGGFRPQVETVTESTDFASDELSVLLDSPPSSNHHPNRPRNSANNNRSMSRIRTRTESTGSTSSLGDESMPASLEGVLYCRKGKSVSSKRTSSLWWKQHGLGLHLQEGKTKQFMLSSSYWYPS